MTYLGPILALITIVIVARLLLRKYYPHAVLLSAGLLMLIVGYGFGLDLPELKQSTGWFGFDRFRYI